MITDLRWDPPGPGSWRYDGSHVPGVPTPIYTRVHAASIGSGIGKVFARFGVPMKTLDERVVNGRLYTRLVPIVGANSRSTKPPPTFVLKIVSRLHPAFRRGAKLAEAALRDRVWRRGVERWKTEIEPRVRAANESLQSEDLRALDDAALVVHIRQAHAHLGEMLDLHFDLHGDDLGPIGDYLAHCQDWNIDPRDAVTVLEGSSPASNAAAPYLARIREALDAHGAKVPDSLDALCAVGPDVAAALDAYLDEYGSRLVSGYDLDARTLAEMPEALLTSIATYQPRPHNDGSAAIARVREMVPPADRATYDDLVTEARLVCDLRDNNGPMTVAWPTGLLRLALLEAGRRLAERGQLANAEHAVELELDELLDAIGGTTTLDPAVIRGRADRRQALSAMPAPKLLGPEMPDPPLDALPPAIARVTKIVLAATSLMEAIPKSDPLAGTGVGDGSYTGVARVARKPEDALATIEPGDVLVVPFTTPAYNTVLGIAGGVVCEEGGPLCHAAVMARELGIPAVVGVRGALEHIADGATVTVDAAASRVTVA